jgi:BirA family biotin operon repressor/biotin-[acetyl-CoA-carboxylase] ligase
MRRRLIQGGGRKMLDEKILDILRDAGGTYVSGEDLCKLSGISRAAVWKRMEKLRDEGYDIEALPHLGYRLIGVPDRLIPGEIKWKLGTRVMGREIVSYKKADSTNDVAYSLAEKGMKEGSVIIAEEQARGKGRHGRQWVSPPKGGIYMSIILRPELAPNEIPKITLLAAVAVSKAIRAATGLPALIKWPNDIMVDGRKVCGILTEMRAQQDSIDFVVLGIGVNVNTPVRSLPKGASSLKAELEEAGKETPVSRIELTRSIIGSVEKYYDILEAGGAKSIIEEWKGLSAMLGSRVKVMLPKRSFEGRAHDIDRDGALIVRLDSGVLEKVSSGDVIMAR